MSDQYDFQPNPGQTTPAPIVPLAHPTTEEVPVQPQQAVGVASAPAYSAAPAYAPNTPAAPVAPTSAPVAPAPQSEGEPGFVGAPHQADTEKLARTKPTLLGWVGAIAVFAILFIVAGAVGYMMGAAS